MSQLTGKNILIVGQESSQTIKLSETLHAHGVIVHNIGCEELSLQKIDTSYADLVLYNHVGEDEICSTVVELLKEKKSLHTVIPVFILIENSEEKIQEALEMGVTDYITQHEETHAVIQKMNVILSEAGNFSSDTVIDITPAPAAVSSTGIKVYLIEDDPLLQNLLSIKLTNSSFPFEFSTNGVGAVEAMHKFEPDVIILDLMLPGRSGFDVLEEIKADEKLKNLPVIVFSNRDGSADRKRASDLGVSGFYVKAMTDLSELVERIESLVK